MTINDDYKFARTVTEQSRSAAPVTPSDTVPLPRATKALYVGAAGDLTVILMDDANPVTFKAVPAGFILPARVGQVMATATTATLIVALF